MRTSIQAHLDECRQTVGIIACDASSVKQHPQVVLAQALCGALSDHK